MQFKVSSQTQKLCFMRLTVGILVSSLFTACSSLLLAIETNELSDQLATKQWIGANDETHRLLLDMGDQDNNRWLDVEEIRAIPCEKLQKIDRLWSEASDNKFGFAVQQQLYLQLGGTPGEYERSAYGGLGQAIGWFGNASQWEQTTITYQELAFQQPTFNSATAPLGHLPIGHNAPYGYGDGLRGNVVMRTQCLF